MLSDNKVPVMKFLLCFLLFFVSAQASASSAFETCQYGCSSMVQNCQYNCQVQQKNTLQKCLEICQSGHEVCSNSCAKQASTNPTSLPTNKSDSQQKVLEGIDSINNTIQQIFGKP